MGLYAAYHLFFLRAHILFSKSIDLDLRVLQLSHGQQEDAGAPQFAQVFTIFWLGVITVSINTKLLGGNL